MGIIVETEEFVNRPPKIIPIPFRHFRLRLDSGSVLLGFCKKTPPYGKTHTEELRFWDILQSLFLMQLPEVADEGLRGLGKVGTFL